MSFKRLELSYPLWNRFCSCTIWNYVNKSHVIIPETCGRRVIKMLGELSSMIRYLFLFFWLKICKLKILEYGGYLLLAIFFESFLDKFDRKKKDVYFTLNFIPRMIQICWIGSWCSFVLFWTWNTILGQILSKKI